jgi:hypothetical protein
MLCVGLHYRLTQPTHFFKKGDRFLGMNVIIIVRSLFVLGSAIILPILHQPITAIAFY